MFASNIDFLCMKVKPFRLHKTEGANNHIEQGDALVFARYPVGVTYDQLAAMLTRVIHDFLSLANKMPILGLIVTNIESVNRQPLTYCEGIFSTKQEMTLVNSVVMVKEIPAWF